MRVCVFPAFRGSSSLEVVLAAPYVHHSPCCSQVYHPETYQPGAPVSRPPRQEGGRRLSFTQSFRYIRHFSLSLRKDTEKVLLPEADGSTETACPGRGTAGFGQAARLGAHACCTPHAEAVVPTCSVLHVSL